ncbi:carbohydrate-binding module family 35 protein, partial [Piromyces sp. E2]
MVVLSENGRIPDIQQCVDQNAWWGYFQTWNSEFILQDSYHTNAQLKEYFNHKVVMNMDELPSFNVNSYEYESGNNNSNNNSNNNANSTECFSVALGYPCCKESNVVYTDNDGDWGVEDNQWCGIGNTSSAASCWSEALGYPCCVSTSDVYYTDNDVYYEAENGNLNGVTKYNELSGYSGTGYVGRFENPGNSVTITITVSKSGMYDLSIIYCANMGQKINSLTINDKNAGDITFPENTGFEELKIGAYYLNSGKNTIGLTASWGWMWVDAFVINDTPNAAKDVTSKLNPTLVNPKAIPAAKKLYDFLKSNYGKRILSGQVGAAGQAGDEGQEIQRIQKATGKLPAVWNMDFIFESNDCTWRPQNPDITEMSINWWKKYQGKGIMAAQWHWNIAGKTGDFAFYKKDTTFSLENAVTEGTWEYNKIIKDIDRVAGHIKKLQAVNMPLIWRPLHENNGDWFWWGNNPKACAKLWKILYERMVNYHGLNNLIWLWN